MHVNQRIFIAIIVTLPLFGCDLGERIGYQCNKLPDIISANKTLTDKMQIVNQIKSINPGFIDINVREVKECPGKAKLEILYATERDRQKIEQIIGKTFFGIPYRMQNI